MSLTKNREGRKAYGYKCLKCGYDAGIKTENSIVKGFGCPCCANRVVIPGLNDITTTDPWMIPFFQGGRDEASKYSKSSSKVITPICPDCGRSVTPQTINNIYTKKGVSCPCSDGISFPNKIIYFLMEQLLGKEKINFFQREYRVEPQNKVFDIYFEKDEKKYFIEMDGGLNHGEVIRKHQVGKKIFSSKLFGNDMVKDRVADSLGIELIRIDCYYSDFVYIQNNLLCSKLSQIIDLGSVDWETIEKQSYSNLVKAVCEYRRVHPDVFVKDAVQHFKLSEETIRSYWTRGDALGWCSFERKKESARSRKARTYYGQSCRVILEDVHTHQIIEFDSMSDFIRKNISFFSEPFTKKTLSNRFKNNNDFIENYEGYNIYKLRRNCDGIRKSS